LLLLPPPQKAPWSGISYPYPNQAKTPRTFANQRHPPILTTHTSHLIMDMISNFSPSSSTGFDVPLNTPYLPGIITDEDFRLFLRRQAVKYHLKGDRETLEVNTKFLDYLLGHKLPYPF